MTFDPAPDTIIFDETDEPLLQGDSLLALMGEAVTEALAGEGLEGGRPQISLSFVSEEDIRDHNNKYRGVDSVTDVLSFPQYANVSEIRTAIKRSLKGAGSEENSAGIPVILGDIMICPKRAGSQAEEYGHSLDRELVYLFVHSLFHILGYDHENSEDKKTMREAEECVMQKIGL